METFKRICHLIKKELKYAEKYVKMAIELKIEDKSIGDALYNIATEKIEHTEKLQNICQRLMDTYEQTEMLSNDIKSIWKWEKEHYIDDVRDIKGLLSLYKG